MSDKVPLMHPDLWAITNRRRGLLIDKEVGGTITATESEELAGLQIVADAYLDSVAPRDTSVLDRLEAMLGIEQP